MSKVIEKSALPAKLARPSDWSVAPLGLVDAWEKSLDLAPRTIEAYGKSARIFIRAQAEKGTPPTREDLLAYRASLQTRHLAASSVNLYMSGIEKFFGWLEAERIYRNVAKDIRKLHVDSSFKRPATRPEDVLAILAVIPTSTLGGIRDYALFNLMARTGLRTIEVQRLRQGDLVQEAGRWVLRVTGKGHAQADQSIVVNDKAYGPLVKYLEACHWNINQKDRPLFHSRGNQNKEGPLSTSAMRRNWKAYCRKAGLDQFSPHSLRHGAATQALRRGVPLQDVSDMLRHKRLDTTMLYRHMERLENPAEDKLDF